MILLWKKIEYFRARQYEAFILVLEIRNQMLVKLAKQATLVKEKNKYRNMFI